MRSQFPAGGMGRGAGEPWPRGRWGPTTLPGRPKSDGPFRLRDPEFRVSRTFLDQLRPPAFQAMDTQLDALPTLPVLARGVSGCLNSAFLVISQHFTGHLFRPW